MPPRQRQRCVSQETVETERNGQVCIACCGNRPHKCAACQQEKARDGFSKKLWNKEAAARMYIPCCESRGKKEKEQGTEDSGKRAANGEGEVAQSAPKRTGVEITCITCRGKFVVSKKKYLKPVKCDACVEAEERKRREEDKAPYFLQYGVGYEVPGIEDLCSKEEPLVNMSLVGKYNLMYYSSVAHCGDKDDNMECIHRTARESWS